MADKDNIIDDDTIKNSIREFIAPYLKFDQGGLCIESFSKLGSDIYAGELAKTGRDPETNFAPELIRKSGCMLLGINENDTLPSINGYPVMPFEKEMMNETMNRDWANVIAEDLIDMNQGTPVDSPLEDARPVSFAEAKLSWLVHVEPGVYYMAIPDEETAQFVYIIDNKTKLPYVFDYNQAAADLKKRRTTNG